MVVNIRYSSDYAINPFFYFQVDKKEFETFPKQYFLSMQVESEKIPSIKEDFYNISSGTVQFIEVDKILLELKEISRKVILIIQSLFLYIFSFCVLTILVVSSFYQRTQRKKSYLYYLL